MDDLPRLLYHTLYYVTSKSTQKEAIEEMILMLLSKGYDIEFVKLMQFTVFPRSGISNRIALSVQYWE
jgi:hypothetical protein